MDNIRLIFVLPEKYSNETEASQIMIQAYETCRQNVKTEVTWIKESQFDTITLNKTDFVIFEDFKGYVFDNLKSTKSAILGPWAVSVCLIEGKPIPNFPWPIYNVAMYGCIVTCSNLPKNKKLEIKEKVQLMGGCYIDTLVEKITHLVTDSPKSEKYLAAAEAGVKLMCSSWIEAVWEASHSANIHADNTEFEEHKCLTFQNLNICCTGLSDSKRREIQKLVAENGGKYSAKLKLKEADFLVCGGTDVSITEKYKAARKYSNIKCVDFLWVTESIAKGYALPHILFPVKRATSTPTKTDNIPNPDFSVLSAISMVNVYDKTSVNSTMNVVASPAFPLHKTTPCKRKGSLKQEYGQLVDDLDIKKAKKAGHFLDGYAVYLTGFSPEHKEKLCKILNFSGATRYDQFSDRVTHVIVGDPDFHEVKLIKSKGQCSLVSVQWLLDSIEKEQPVSDNEYLLSSTEGDKSSLGSPLSKKGLSLLRTDRTIVQDQVEEAKKTSHSAEDNIEKDIVQQYLKPSNTVPEDDTLAQLLKDANNFPDFSNQVGEPPQKMHEFKPSESSTQQDTTSVTQDETETETGMFFDGLKFLVIGFEDNHFAYIKELIEGFSGELVKKTYKGIPDYIVVPVFNDAEIRHTATEIVNELFINECAKEGGLLADICYYHRPIDLPESSPLGNCVITISGYSSYERNFLKNLIEALGGFHQEQFSRVTSEAKGVVASTHLISDKPSGKKYQASVKWGLPAVNKDWLLECARTGSRAPENNYLVAESENVTMPKNTSVAVSHAATPEVSGTPLNNPGSSNSSRVLTPVNRMLPKSLNFNDSTDDVFTQVTPVNKILKRYRESSSHNTPVNQSPEQFPWMGIKTPDTPLGACIRENRSPQLRKECELWLRQFPDSPIRERRKSTPLSEIKRKLWDKILKRGEPPVSTQGESELNTESKEPDDANKMEMDEPKELSPAEEIQNKLIDSRLQQMEEMLSASGGGSRRQSRNFQSTIPIPEGTKVYKDSQTCTVGWDFTEQEHSNFVEAAPNKPKIFIITGVRESERSLMVQQLESLGASVSDLSSYDPSSTHLLCPKPARNEKVLACMAAGKWILHTSYLERSLRAGHLLDEEEYEFGNPKSVGKFSVEVLEKVTETRIRRMHWWRKEVARRGYGAFNDMRAIVVAEKKDPLIRVIEAGGGLVVNVNPPFDDTVHATHCLVELRSVSNLSDYTPLAQQGIYLLNTAYISDYLHQPETDIREFILPHFAKYYSRN